MFLSSCVFLYVLHLRAMRTPAKYCLLLYELKLWATLKEMGSHMRGYVLTVAQRCLSGTSNTLSPEGIKTTQKPA